MRNSEKLLREAWPEDWESLTARQRKVLRQDFEAYAEERHGGDVEAAIAEYREMVGPAVRVMARVLELSVQAVSAVLEMASMLRGRLP